MSLLATERIYVIDDQAEIWHRPGDITFDEADVFVEAADYDRPLHVSGLESDDIAVTLALSVSNCAGDDPALKSIPFLVLSADKEGIIMPGDIVEADPRRWCSDYLASLIRRVELQEFLQFELYNLTHYVVGKR